MRTTLFYFILLLSLMGCKQGYSKKNFYPEYNFQSISGKTLHITKIKNRLEILNQTKPILFLFIQPSCNQCFVGIEHIQRLIEEYENKISFIPILITNNENNQEEILNEAQTINQNYNLNFDFYFSKDGNDFLQTFERQSNTSLIVLYNQKLQKIQEYEGLVPEEMIEFDLMRILKQMEKNNVSKS